MLSIPPHWLLPSWPVTFQLANQRAQARPYDTPTILCPHRTPTHLTHSHQLSPQRRSVACHSMLRLRCRIALITQSVHEPPTARPFNLHRSSLVVTSASSSPSTSRTMSSFLRGLCKPTIAHYSAVAHIPASSDTHRRLLSRPLCALLQSPAPPPPPTPPPPPPPPPHPHHSASPTPTTAPSSLHSNTPSHVKPTQNDRAPAHC